MKMMMMTMMMFVVTGHLGGHNRLKKQNKTGNQLFLESGDSLKSFVSSFLPRNDEWQTFGYLARDPVNKVILIVCSVENIYLFWSILGEEKQIAWR